VDEATVAGLRAAGELFDRLAGEEATPETALRLGSELRRRWPAELVSAALTQHRLRAAAAAKFRRAARMLFTQDGLEQASAEPVARHRARRYEAVGGQVADLCCGIGGDLLALAARHQVLAVDRDPGHLALAAHNAGVYEVGARVTTRTGDVREVDLTGVGAVFIDPARRGRSGRLPAGASEPPLAWCTGLASRVPAVGIKAAPGLARTAVPDGWELELVADGRDLKEAVLWSPALATAPRRATILPAAQTLLPAPGPPVAVAEPGGYLLDPNPAVTRAGLVTDLARRVGAWQIDPRIAFLSADREPRTPFARTLRVLDSAPWHEKRFARRLRELGIGAVDIRRRGHARPHAGREPPVGSDMH
jgi:SAM-dependent methyltransferase